MFLLWRVAQVNVLASNGWLLGSFAVLAAVLLLVPAAMRLEAPDRQRSRVALLQLTLLATLGVAAASQWILPAANQQWRVQVARTMGSITGQIR